MKLKGVLYYSWNNLNGGQAELESLVVETLWFQLQT
jgi:hypothetical protein